MVCGLASWHTCRAVQLGRGPAACPAAQPSLPAGPPGPRTDEVTDGGQLPQVLQELVQGVAVTGGKPVLVLQQQLQVGEERTEVQARPPSDGRPPQRPPAAPLTLCVLTSSPTVMYTTGLATATMSEYSSIAKRSSGSGTWQARTANLLSPEAGHVWGQLPPILFPPQGPPGPPPGVPCRLHRAMLPTIHPLARSPPLPR